MLNKDKLKSQSTELQDLYKQLDSMLEDGDNCMLPLLDNEHNSYAYSDRVRLFDALNLAMNDYNAYSDIDIVNRVVHFISIQHQLFSSTKQKEEMALQEGLPSLLDEQFINIIDNIIALMLDIITTLVSSVNIEELATFIVNLINKLKR